MARITQAADLVVECQAVSNSSLKNSGASGSGLGRASNGLLELAQRRPSIGLLPSMSEIFGEDNVRGSLAVAHADISRSWSRRELIESECASRWKFATGLCLNS